MLSCRAAVAVQTQAGAKPQGPAQLFSRLATVRSRNALTWARKFMWDLRYVDRASLWMDLKILVKTVLQVVKREGISHPGEATMHEFQGDAP